MENERIIWAQENIEPKTPEVWRDIDVPNTRLFPKTESPPFVPFKMTVSEWASILKDNGMIGVYRAFTSSGRLVAVIITSRLMYDWEIKEIGK